MLVDAYQLVVALQAATLEGLATGASQRIPDGTAIIPIIALQ
jgi:hypothetical protein